MNNTDANRISPGYELKDELARLCLPSASRDPNRKLGWVNSICILFLAIGIFGAKLGVISHVTPPLIEEIIPTIIEPVILPPQSAENQKQEKTETEKTETPQVVVVTPVTPNINFSVPTIGNLVAPSALAQAPPLNPLQPPAPLKAVPSTLNTTGSGGERPQPPYPKIALEQGEQGTVTVLITADDAGKIQSADVKESSGFPILDRSTLDFVRRRWTAPVGQSNHLFLVTITYKLQTD